MPELPSAVRQRTMILPTPLVADVIFTERVVNQTRVIPEYGTAHPNTARWPDHKFAYARERNEPTAQDVYDYFYVADRANQDNYNFSFTHADIGGTRFDAVTRTYVTLRTAFTPQTPAMGMTMPNTPVDKFTGAYVLAEKRQTRIGDQELDSLYVAETHVYVKRCTVRQIGVDSLNGKALSEDTTLYFRGETISGTPVETLFADTGNAYWGLQSDGTQRNGQQLSCDWFAVTTSQVIGGTFTEGVVAVDTFTTNDRYFWPPVLETYELLDWVKKDGGTEIYPALRFHPEGYQGPCRNTITRTWSKTPFSIPVVDILKPTRIYYACPYYTVNIPECLHGAVAFQCDTRSDDPVYERNVGSTRYFAATNATTWPATVVAYDDQEPFRGGYLRTRKVVERPTIPANVNWTTEAPI